MKRTHLHDETPCIVVGDTLAALYWAATLQRSTFTILLTPTDVSRDPYIATAAAVIRPRDVLKPGSVLYGRLLEAEDGIVRIAATNGAEFALPARVVLKSAPSALEVNGREWPPRGVIPGEFMDEDHLVLEGEPAAAVSAALEFLASSARHHVIWRVRHRNDTWSRWHQAIEAMGGTVDMAPETPPEKDGIPGLEIDTYGRVPGRKWTFLLPPHDISEPSGTLYENISTCALSTGRYPLYLKQLRGGHHRIPPVVLSRRARVNLIRRGFARLALTAHSREHRTEEITLLRKTVDRGSLSL